MTRFTVTDHRLKVVSGEAFPGCNRGCLSGRSSTVGLPLRVKLSQDAIVRPKVSFQSIIDGWASTTGIENFLNEELGSRGKATRTHRLATFPDYLLIQLQKFTVNADWTPRKLDIDVQWPVVAGEVQIDLSKLRAKGRQPGEAELSLGEAAGPGGAPGAAPPHVDQTIVNGLLDMGFPEPACRKAAYVTQNAGLEPATAWIMEHMEDADFASPHPDLAAPGGASAAGGGGAASADLIEQLVMLGFTPLQAKAGLKATNNDPNAAAMWLFENAASVPEVEDEPMQDASAAGAPASDASAMRDGASGKYKLVGFISHMGSSTSCGHYVCHLVKDGRWVIFNDEKVAYSNQPPKGLGYIYLFQRV